VDISLRLSTKSQYSGSHYAVWQSGNVKGNISFRPEAAQMLEHEWMQGLSDDEDDDDDDDDGSEEDDDEA